MALPCFSYKLIKPCHAVRSSPLIRVAAMYACSEASFRFNLSFARPRNTFLEKKNGTISSCSNGSEYPDPRMVILWLFLDQGLSLFCRVFKIFRVQSCSHSFQCGLARHDPRARTAWRRRGGSGVVEKSGRSVSVDTSRLIAYRLQLHHLPTPAFSFDSCFPSPCIRISQIELVDHLKR